MSRCGLQNRYSQHRLANAAPLALISHTADQPAKPILLPVPSHLYDERAAHFLPRQFGIKGIESWDERNEH